mmetsp:Transcript_12880/g.47091  ORF Transcript_12880/g.47091 Transcript_12880/m.47091 type:complete len:256 (+) Transcript_12880:75-842(+)
MLAARAAPAATQKMQALRLPASRGGSLFARRAGTGSAKLAVAPRPVSSRRRHLAISCSAAEADVAASSEELPRLRLDNLSPAPGSTQKKKRKGRGIAAGQGASCGYGMRGQKSRSGGSTRPGFEGGQNPLYRKLPKLKGICGGMKKGQKMYNVVNVRDLAALPADTEVSLESLVDMGMLRISGRERKLPLKVLGEGDIDVKLTIRAGKFSGSARQKLEAAGCTLVDGVGERVKWTREAHEAKLAGGNAEVSEESS